MNESNLSTDTADDVDAVVVVPSASGLEDDSLTLRQVAARGCKRVDIGAAVLPKPLFQADIQDYDGQEELADAAMTVSSTHYARLLQKEFNAVVVEHHLKWAPLLLPKHEAAATSSGSSASPTASVSLPDAPGPSRRASGQPPPTDPPGLCLHRYDFTHADSIVDWALERNLKVKGHVLVWHVTSPKCLADMEPDAVRQALKRHIYTVMGHYRGRIHVWDVVNEALAPDGTLADNVFMKKLGPSYIELSFQWAHEADPSAILLYNDNKVESVDSKKGQGFYELLADLKAKGVPVHGCGMQAHFNAAGVGVNTCPTPRMVKQQIRRLGQLDLSVNISEMDVRVSQLEQHLRDSAQKQIYHDILAAALSEPAFDGIFLWGVSDRHTWVTHFYYDDEPLVFDESYARKDAYYGLRDALASLTPAGRVGGEGVLLDTDVDVNGNVWGHLWMRGGSNEPTVNVPVDDGGAGAGAVGGDARPDWEQEDDLPPSDDEAEDGDDDAESVGDDDEPVELTKRVGLPEIS